MNIIKNLNKNLCKKDNRFTLISEDGDGWRTFGYKELQLGTHRTGDKTYLQIFFDWDNYSFTYNEWRATAESELTSIFNGVDNINVDRLVCICEKIIKGLNRLNDEVKDEEINMDAVADKIREEIAEADKALEVCKAMEWWKLDRYDVRWASNAINNVERARNDAQVKLGTLVDLPRDNKKSLCEELLKGGRVEISDYNINKIYEYEAKCKEV